MTITQAVQTVNAILRSNADTIDTRHNMLNAREVEALAKLISESTRQFQGSHR